MLLCIEVNAVHDAGTRNGSGIKKSARFFQRDVPVGRCHGTASSFSTQKFLRYCSYGASIGGGATINICGIAIPGSMGAYRIARAMAAKPWAECHASF